MLVEGHSSARVVGRSAIFRGEISDVCFQNTLLRFRSMSVKPEFAHQYFRYCVLTGQFSKVAKQTTIAHLGSTRFSNMSFPVPPPEIEDGVVAEVTAIEESLALAEGRKGAVDRMIRSILKFI